MGHAEFSCRSQRIQLRPVGGQNSILREARGTYLDRLKGVLSFAEDNGRLQLTDWADEEGDNLTERDKKVRVIAY